MSPRCLVAHPHSRWKLDVDHGLHRGSYRAVRHKTVQCRAQSAQEFNWQKINIDRAAKEYLEGLERGDDEDDLIAQTLGVPSAKQLTELQEKYADKLKEKLLVRVVELRKARDAASRNFAVGKLAYERGDYFYSVELLERAVQELGATTNLGGEAQLWLALAYSAVGREEDCIAVYHRIESEHPSRKLKKQAESLRYIMEAPKLELGEDERVTIPLLQDAEPNKRVKAIRKYSAPAGSKAHVVKSSYLDDIWNFTPPGFIPANKYVQVALTVVVVGTCVYVNYMHSIGEL